MYSKLWVVIPVFIAFAFLLIIIPSTAILISNNSYLGNPNLVYGQPDQTNSNVANSLNIQNIPVKKVHVGDIDIAYKTIGRGDPILLFNGASDSMHAWDPSFLRSLSSNHTVIVFDSRGVGNTTIGSKPYSMQQLANDTAGLLDALKIQKADVLGYSLGSFVAQQLTVTHPEKVNRLILVASSCGGKEGIPKPPEFIKLQAEIVNKSLNDDNLYIPHANGLIIAGKIPGAWLVQIKDAGHAVMDQYPDEISKILQTFLSPTTTTPSS